VCGSSWL
jgi:hypothetical protein